MQEIIDPAPIATVPQRPIGAVQEVESNRAVAQTQAMVIMAKRYPRDVIEARDRVLIECQRSGVAEQAIYSYARGGSEIQGPSIRLAEVLARNWGNLDAGVKELSRTEGQSEMMSYCIDLETNYRQVKEFTVIHERSTRKGTFRLTDGRDIYETIANQASRRLRACILAVIPSDVIDAAVSQCEQTLKAKADTSPEAIKKLIDTFASLGVTREQIEKRIQRHLDAIAPAQLISLRKIYNSLRDGMSSPADWFIRIEEEKAESLKDRLKAKQGDTKAPAMAPGPCPDKPGETMMAEFCGTCKGRVGCPAWE